MPKSLGRHLFTFAVVADSHVNQAEASTSSPYACNALANARSRYVVSLLNTLDPDFCIHLGDLVHPVPSLPTFEESIERFRALYGSFRGDLHLIPGNHDVGDKPLDWMPAGTVTEEHIDKYRDLVGRDYYSFDHEDVHFVLINAQLINTGFASEVAQKAWLAADLESCRGRRVMLFSHYPPYTADADERGHYDNLDEPGRSWVLDLCRENRIEALYAGHVHNFFYDRHGCTDIHILPSVCFVRQDYSEMFRVEAADEHGRNDVAKLGFFLVKVHEHGHVNELVRTLGASLGPGEPDLSPTRRVRAPSVKHRWSVPVGVDLRHSWAERTEIPPSGSLDEFERKIARNDYPLMALWEMGVRRLRLPLHDAVDPYTLKRMAILRDMGHQLTFYVHGPLSPAREDALTRVSGLADGVELIMRLDDAETLRRSVAVAKEKAKTSVFVSKLWSSEDFARKGERYYHFIRHGFAVDDAADLEALTGAFAAGESPDGVVIRLRRSVRPWEAMRDLRRTCERLELAVSVHVQLAAETSETDEVDDLSNACRVVETMLAAATLPLDRVFLDTFVDHDRGYFVHNGFVDRRYNPRLAAKAFQHLLGTMHEVGGMRAGRLVDLEHASAWLGSTTDGDHCAVVLPRMNTDVDSLPVADAPSKPSAQAWVVDLASGVVSPAPCRWNGSRVSFEPPLRCFAPVFVRLAGTPGSLSD